MKSKRILAGLLMVSSLLCSCGNNDRDGHIVFTSYSEWRFSEDAYDCNSDGLINESDYNIFYQYHIWIEEGKDFDIDGNRVINIDDYLLYSDETNPLSNWVKNSPEDLNGDSLINITDYQLFVTWQELVGNYDYYYSSDNLYRFYIAIGNGEVLNSVNFLSLIGSTFEITSQHKLLVNTDALRAESEAAYAYATQLLNSTELNLLSECLLEVNFKLKLDEEGSPVDFSLLFEKEEDVSQMHQIKWGARFTYTLFEEELSGYVKICKADSVE